MSAKPAAALVVTAPIEQDHVPATAQEPPPQLLEVAAVAAALSVSKWSVYRWAAAGTIPCIRAGRKIRFILSDVLAALKDPGREQTLPSHVAPRQPIPCRIAAAPRPEKPTDPAERLRAAIAATRVLRDG